MWKSAILKAFFATSATDWVTFFLLVLQNFYKSLIVSRLQSSYIFQWKQNYLLKKETINVLMDTMH